MLKAINDELAAITTRLERIGVKSRLISSKNLGDTKLIAEKDTNQVKIEVNAVFRGTVSRSAATAE